MIVQIYSLTDVETARAVVSLGVDYNGFVAGRYNIVASELDFKEARAIVEAVSPGATAVALTMATDVDEILQMVSAVQPGIVHISTDPLDMDETATRRLRHRLPSHVRLMKAIPVGEAEETLPLIRRFEPMSDIFLLDTKVAGFPGVGATGQTHDWRVSRQVVETTRCPVILAGGLFSGNVVQAIQQVRPWGVDSCTETNVPGKKAKDLTRVKAFVAAVRHWERDSE